MIIALVALIVATCNANANNVVSKHNPCIVYSAQGPLVGLATVDPREPGVADGRRLVAPDRPRAPGFDLPRAPNRLR